MDLKRNASNIAAADGMPIIGAYHFGSHYSNSGIVLNYLVRLPPFTQLVLEYQGEIWGGIESKNGFKLHLQTIFQIITSTSQIVLSIQFQPHIAYQPQNQPLI